MAAPLADKIRPRTLDDVVGQEHIIGKGRLLYRAIQADKLGSVIFYGPPGTGKTTLLRMIAGFNSIEGGEFRFGDKVINDMDPSKRNIGMVFQNYAIFPNMTVRKNVEFGLRNRKVPKAEMWARVEKAMKLTQIDQYAKRQPQQLRQRSAVSPDRSSSVSGLSLQSSSSRQGNHWTPSRDSISCPSQ